MGRGTEKMLKAVKQFAEVQYKIFTVRYGQQMIDLLELPIRLVLSPFTLAFDVAGSAPRGFGLPELASKLSFSAIFVRAPFNSFVLEPHISCDFLTTGDWFLELAGCSSSPHWGHTTLPWTWRRRWSASGNFGPCQFRFWLSFSNIRRWNPTASLVHLTFLVLIVLPKIHRYNSNAILYHLVFLVVIFLAKINR
ncbi:hypothetical protein BHM03_00030908 [Ensete ventricosum]|nr:hypothetical protein BHM03_00030908 [Ensete ventricosum]